MAHVESVTRALNIIEALAHSPAGLSEAARRVDLPKSTVARMLATLEESEAVERDEESGLYRLGPLIHRLPTAGSGLTRLIAFARPHLEELTRRTGEAAGLSVPNGYRVHHVDQTEAFQPVQVRDWTGEMAPMHVGPSGFCMMAFWPDDQLESYLKTDLAQLTHNTVTDAATIHERLDLVRAQGFIWAFEEFVEGINSVAAPVLEPGDAIVGAIHVHGPAYRFPGADGAAPIGVMVAEAAQRLSSSLSL